MQAARLTQDHYGFFRQPSVYRKQTEADKTAANRSRPSVLPAERVVEGEVLRNRNNSAGDSLDQLLQRGRFANSSAANSPDATPTAQAAQRAINAYLDNAAAHGASGGGSQSRSVDYYA
jgi:hypothetical protein